MNNEELLKKIIEVERKVENLSQEYFNNNFSARQDFAKYSDFKTMIKVPSYTTLPPTCQVGELVESGGKLRICSATNTWTIVGSQS